MNLADDRVTPAYHELYMYPNMNLHRLLFYMLAREPQDTFSLIDAYMRTSEIRERQDRGNWSALCKGSKQLFNSFDHTGCPPKTEDLSEDTILLGWMADIYVLFQWRYNLPSKELSERVPAKELARIYNPLHEASEKIACEKILHKYFPEREKILEEDGQQRGESSYGKD